VPRRFAVLAQPVRDQALVRRPQVRRPAARFVPPVLLSCRKFIREPFRLGAFYVKKLY